MLVTAAVTRQEHDLVLAERADQEIVGGAPERRVDALPLLVGEAFELVEPTATDDPDDGHGMRITTLAARPATG